jgi:hypothetical protein
MPPTSERAARRVLVWGTAFAGASVLVLPRAGAQHHHHGGGEDRGAGIQVHAGLSLEVGQVESFGGERDYQGLALMGGARWRRVELGLHVPFYRIELGSTWGEGLGDPHLEGRWIAVSRGAVEAGLSLAVMPPVGDDDRGLAMGHWMIMSGGLARVSRGRLTASASLGYGGAPGGGRHAEHGGGVWPPVAPMNTHEIEGSLHPQLMLGRGIRVGASLAGAVPLGDGERLALVGGGATIALGERFELGVGLAHGFLGHPAGLRGTTHVMAAF